jgi:hypothetical protein
MIIRSLHLNVFMKNCTFIFLCILVIASCTSRKNTNKEEIRLDAESIKNDSVSDIETDSASASAFQTYPSAVITTGLPDQRLVTIYRKEADAKRNFIETYSSRSYYNDYGSEFEQHFMPGIDLIHGYNLINIAHHNFSTGKTTMLFNHSVVVRSIYYPSFVQDSINKKPVTRNYFLISAYSDDTNNDTLINKKDLRRLILVNADASEQKSLLPSDYAVVRSQYDAMRDVMYLFARKDLDSNGKSESSEPLHIFWISLSKPEEAKRLY